jgi:hypothetical protein
MSNTVVSQHLPGNVPDLSLEQQLAVVKEDKKHLLAEIDDLTARCERIEGQLVASIQRDNDSQIITANFIAAIGKITAGVPSIPDDIEPTSVDTKVDSPVVEPLVSNSVTAKRSVEADEIFLSMTTSVVHINSPGDTDIATDIDSIFTRVIDYVSNGLITARLLIDKPGFIRNLMKLVNYVEILHC